MTIEQILEAANAVNHTHFPQGIALRRQVNSTKWGAYILNREGRVGDTADAIGATPEEAMAFLEKMLVRRLKENADRARREADDAEEKMAKLTGGVK